MSKEGETKKNLEDKSDKQHDNAEADKLDTEMSDIDESEGKIVLRKLDSGKRHSSTGDALSRRKSIAAMPAIDQKDNDSSSITTTTSDVNSTDDAASIVSRLSQIVVEQGGKLDSTGDDQQFLKNGSQDDRFDSEHRRNSSVLSQGPTSNQLRPVMSRVKSAVNISNIQASAREASLAANVNSSSTQRKQRHGSDIDERGSRKIFRMGSDSPGSVSSNKPRFFPDHQQLPEIHVIDDGSSTSINDNMRSRAMSFVAAKNSDDPPDTQFMRRNKSSKFLPERGDLRHLESSRNYQAGSTKDSTTLNLGHRNRSNTANSSDKSNFLGPSGENILNIRRSTWTLSEFDQTFNKSKENKPEINVVNDSDKSTPDISETTPIGNQAKNYHERSQNSSLLIRASLNAKIARQNSADGLSNIPMAKSKLSTGNDQKINIENNNNNNNNNNNIGINNDRRPSYSHSIVSFASSLDSFYAGVGKSVRRGVSSVKRRPKNQNGGDCDEDEEMSCYKSCFNMATFRQWIPILAWLPSYNLGYFGKDLAAGLAVAVLNISTSLSAAVVAQTDLSVAFRASIVNTFVYAILCSSRHTSFGSWSIMSQMLLVSVQRALNDELILERLNMGSAASWEPEEYERWHLNIIIMYTFLIGLVQLVCGLLNLGNILASFIPEALCSSMIAGTAFTMAIGQLANMCGTTNKILWSIEKNTTELWADFKNPPVDITDIFDDLFRWIQQILLLVKHYDQINMVCVIISTVSVILLFLNQYGVQRQLERLFKRKIFIPFEMILLIMMIIISYTLDLSGNYRVATCGPINIDFNIPNLPNLRLIRELWFQSLATALISYTMVYAMAKTYSNKMNYEVDCNQELIACGAGNLVGGLFDALPATASFSRTAGQVEAGGQTQMASIINCIALIVLAKLLGHLVAVLPICVMAATLFYGFVRMMARFSEVFIYWRICKVDFAIWMVTFVAILTLDLVNGFVYGFIFSILTMLYRAQNRRCYMLGSIGNSDVYVPLVKYPAAHEIDGIKIFQFCGPIHYVCADLFERFLRQKTRVDVKQIISRLAGQDLSEFNPRDLNLPTHIVLDFSMISYIDSAGINVIKKIIEDYQSINIKVFLASLASHVATVVKSDHSLWNAYKGRFYITLADAVHCAMNDNCFQQSKPPVDNTSIER